MNSVKNANTECFSLLEWLVESGMISTHAKRCGALSTKNLSGSVIINDEELFLKDAEVISHKTQADENGNQTYIIEFSFNDYGVVWRWEIKGNADWVELTALLRNDSPDDIYVSDWKILNAQDEKGGIIDLGKNPEQVRFFRWQPWDMRVERFAATEADHNSDNVCHIYDPSSGLTFFAGFVTLGRMQGYHTLHYVPTAGITQYSAGCLFGRHKIGASCELRSETLRISYHENPYAALEGWANRIYDAYKPSFECALGVCADGSAWIDAFTNEKSWPEILLDFATAVREKFKGFDIGCLPAGTHQIIKDGLPGNWLTFENASGCEGGYKSLFAKLWKMGFSFKLWFSPFWFLGEAQYDNILEENKENLLRDINGNLITTKVSWEFDRNHNNLNDEPYLTMYYLDGTHPRTKKYLTEIFTAYRAMGARAYMLDFLSVPANARMYDDTLLPMEAGRKILKTIREIVGHDTHLQTAVASNPGFVGCVDAARVGRDYGEGRPMYPYHNWRNSTYCMHDLHFANEHLFIQNAAASWFMNRKLFINDLNCLTIDKPIPLEHARISTTMFGLSGDSPMVLGDDIRNIDSERLGMIKMCMPRTQGIPVPVDLFSNVAPESYCHVLKKAIRTPWDSYLLVAVFNTDNEVYNTTLDFVKLGLSPDEIFSVFEFWNGEYVGTYEKSYSCAVPAHSCRLYRISRHRKYPWLLSTDMHIEQGNAEVESLEWNEKAMTLKGVATRPAGECGSLFFLTPRQFRLINHDKTNTMKEVIDMQTVIRLPMEFRSDKEKFELRFEIMNTPFVARKGWLPYATEEEWRKYVEAHHKPDDTRVIE
ncbi:MAG TPA: hypothetical protein PLK08_02700 [Phycisphaerae bacterium]|nr:hypothetical protein [Phycisphaerae bacterium]